MHRLERFHSGVLEVLELFSLQTAFSHVKQCNSTNSQVFVQGNSLELLIRMTARPDLCLSSICILHILMASFELVHPNPEPSSQNPFLGVSNATSISSEVLCLETDS